MSSSTRGWSTARIAFTFLAYATLALLWYKVHGLHMPPHHKPTHDQDIQFSYPWINKEWFDNKLPDNVEVRLEEHDRGELGFTGTDGHGNYIIWISPSKNPAMVEKELTLFHETCHVATYTDFDGHGPLWVDCMRKLAANGAFDYLW